VACATVHAFIEGQGKILAAAGYINKYFIYE
jgi:hypothetical protein